jgi:hypothetical protein
MRQVSDRPPSGAAGRSGLTEMGDPGVQDPSKRGLSTFLADHEECGKGFEIQRREGSDGSVVRVVCGGCGKAIEYPAAAQTELPLEVPAARRVTQRFLNRERRPARGSASVAGNSGSEGAEPRNSAPSGGGAKAGSEPGAPSLTWPRWLSMPLVIALICGGLVLIVVGIASNSGTSDSTPESPEVPVTPPLLTTPAPPPKEAARPPRLDRRSFAERVSIGIPEGWSAGVSGGAVTVAALNGNSEIQVYFEHAATPEAQLRRQARTFLLQRHPGARVAEIGQANMGGRRAPQIRVAYPTGTESAVVLVAGGYTYLILERLGKPLSAELQRTSDAVVASFRPT